MVDPNFHAAGHLSRLAKDHSEFIEEDMFSTATSEAGRDDGGVALAPGGIGGGIGAFEPDPGIRVSHSPSSVYKSLV